MCKVRGHWIDAPNPWPSLPMAGTSSPTTAAIRTSGCGRCSARWWRRSDSLAVTATIYCGDMNATARKEGPTYLRLVRPNEIAGPEPYFRIETELAPNGEEAALVTVARHPRLLTEVSQRLGDRLSLRKITPHELTFAIRDVTTPPSLKVVELGRRPANAAGVSSSFAAGAHVPAVGTSRALSSAASAMRAARIGWLRRTVRTAPIASSARS